MIETIFNEIIRQGYGALDELDSIAPNANEYSNKWLMKLLKENRDTVIGRKYDFSNIHSYEEYKARVPLSEYSDYKELIDRISENGEENILFSRPIAQFCPTTGTTSAPKLIPIVKESVKLDTIYSMPASLALGDRALKAMGKSGMPKTKGLFLVEIGDLSKSKSGIDIGGICSTSVRASYNLLDAIACSPREIITPDDYMDSKYLHLLFALRERNLGWIGSGYMTTVAGIMDTMANRWQDLCDDIETGTINSEIEMSEQTRISLTDKLLPDPDRARELRAIFSEGFDLPICPKIWPRLSFIAAIGSGSFRIHTEKVRRFVGEEIPISNIVIEASESLIAVANGCNSDDFVLIPQAAFLEFIPEDTPDEIYTMDQLKIGECYEIVVTTLSGLYRYRLGDILEVTGYYGEIPRVRFSHRGNVMLNIAGEKTTEADLLRAIKFFSGESGITISEYAAYADMTKAPGRYAVLIEPDGDIDMHNLPGYEAMLDDAFCRTFGYKYERASGNIDPVKLYIQQPQTHLLYREMQIMKGAPRNQLKPVRVIRTEEQKTFFTRMIEGICNIAWS